MGAPPSHPQNVKKMKGLVKEEAIPEAQVIKQNILQRYFEACSLVAEINYKRRFLRQISPIDEGRLSQLVQDLFLKLAMKDLMKSDAYEKIEGWTPEKYGTTLKLIREGTFMPFKDAFDVLLVIGEVIQILGIYKIEFVRDVNPNYAYMAEEILGDF